MTVRWYSVVVDCGDLHAQASWWAEVLEWEKAYESPEEVALAGSHMRAQPVGSGPALVFVQVPERMQVKNRLLIDLAPPAGSSQDAEVDRLIALGAQPVNVGQDERSESFVVLADPEGNEFCVLTARD